MRFAIMEAKFGFAKILSEFKFSLNSKTNVPLQLNKKTTLLEDKNGIWVDFKKL